MFEMPSFFFLARAGHDNSIVKLLKASFLSQIKKCKHQTCLKFEYEYNYIIFKSYGSKASMIFVQYQN